MTIYLIESTTAEKIPVPIVTSADPTGTLPRFRITQGGTDPVWLAAPEGEWLNTWDPGTGEITALTPLIGNGQTLDVDQGNDYSLYLQWDIPGTPPEIPATRANGTVRVT